MKTVESDKEGMLRFWGALFITVFFYARMDILIWQRIFEANELWELGIGTYHWGWLQALFGFMILGALLFYPNLRRMITFPISLAVLAFSGAEDILYYWLDRRPIPAHLPWLNSNPLILKPVTSENLVISAVSWLFVILLVDVVGGALEARLKDRAWRPGRELPGHLRSLWRALFQVLVRGLRFSLAVLPSRCASRCRFYPTRFEQGLKFEARGKKTSS